MLKRLHFSQRMHMAMNQMVRKVSSTGLIMVLAPSSQVHVGKVVINYSVKKKVGSSLTMIRIITILSVLHSVCNMNNINYAKLVGCVESFFMCMQIIKNTGVSKQGSNCWGSVSYLITLYMIQNSFFGHGNQFTTNKLTCNSYFTLPVGYIFFVTF